ncbi:armadillo-type protein [Mycena metata]|uniref:Armadillo-type protein n=1 Tax=Mycena metata TaxID=1033252 RepID=A0AAD7HGD8_9AGAR|nr:armadillo-type protein [Mycena metata]
MPHATLSCGCLFYRSSVAPLELHIELILIRIAQLCATFPLARRRYDNCWQRLRVAYDSAHLYHAWSQAVDAFSHYLNDRDHARARLPSTPASSRYRPLLIPTAYQLLSLHPTVLRSAIIKSADQQVSIFLVFSPFPPPFSFSFVPPTGMDANDAFAAQVAGPEERARIGDAIYARGGEMIMHRCVPSLSSSSFALRGSSPHTTSGFSNWAVQCCLEAATGPEERRQIVACMRGRIVDLATNCYGYCVLQKALDCKEELCMLIVPELLRGDPATTLVNKHVSLVWNHVALVDPTGTGDLRVAAYVNKSLNGKWAVLACHKTGSLVVQHAFENLEASAKEGIVDELPGQGAAVFGEIPILIVIDTVLEHGSEKHRQTALEHLFTGLLEFATNKQGSKGALTTLKEGGKEMLDRVVQRMCEPVKGARLAMTVNLALSLTGS